MTICASNSIYGGAKNKAYTIRYAVQDYEKEKRIRQKRLKKWLITHSGLKAAVCTQCLRGMSHKTASLQIENNRENAPICIPCIMGIPRKPLIDVINKSKEYDQRERNNRKRARGEIRASTT